jgi:hypothetical protein
MVHEGQYVILYHFNQFNNHMSQSPVFCWKSVFVTCHQGLCWVDPTCDKAKIPKLSSEISHFSAFLHSLPLTAFGCQNSPQKCMQNCHLRPFVPYWMSKFLFGHGHWPSVLNWSNVSQSQVWLKWYSMYVCPSMKRIQRTMADHGGFTYVHHICFDYPLAYL